MSSRIFALLLALIGVVLCGAPHPHAHSPHALKPAAASACGTCDSLGYQCVGETAPLDNCGVPVVAASCPVPSCATFCLAMFGVDGGFCNSQTHQCLCDTETTISPGADSNGTCDRPLCDRLSETFAQCIPAHFVDDCTGQAVAVDACTATLNPCAAGCACSPLAGTCVCGSANTTDEPEPEPEPEPTPVPSPPYVAGEFHFGGGAIGGTVVSAATATAFFAAMFFAWMGKLTPASFVSQNRV